MTSKERENWREIVGEIAETADLKIELFNICYFLEVWVNWVYSNIQNFLDAFRFLKTLKNNGSQEVLNRRFITLKTTGISHRIISLNFVVLCFEV